MKNPPPCQFALTGLHSQSHSRRTKIVGRLLGPLLLFALAPLPAYAYPRPGSTELASGASGATSPLSADGRYVAFLTYALLGPDWINNVFVYDRATGTTERVSVASDGTESNADSNLPSISGDGRFVAFQSFASNLVAGDTNGASDVFVHDQATGITEVVSVASDGTQGNVTSFFPAISADGRQVAFWSSASNLVPGDTNGSRDVFVHDRTTGTTERVSVASDGAEANAISSLSAISADGRHVAFWSSASNLVPGDTNGAPDVFVHDRAAGATERVSVASDGTEANGFSQGAGISADGRFVVITSTSSNLVPGDTNGVEVGQQKWDVFVHDRVTGTTERVSVASDGTEANDDSISGGSVISADGRFVAFQSFASNLVAGDTNGANDVFVHDRVTGTTELVSVASDGTEAEGLYSDSYAPSISADGRHVAFWIDWGGVLVRDRGGRVGVLGTPSVEEVPHGVAVSGRATFSGAVISTIDDPAGDGAAGAGPGTDLTGASLTYRPENEDLLVRLRGVTARPEERCTSRVTYEPLFSVAIPVEVCEQGAGAPGALSPGVLHRRTLYGMGFELEAISYEIRARPGSKFAVEAWLDEAEFKETRTFSDPQHLALYRCDPECTELTPLDGGMGTTGVEIWASVPLSALGASEGDALNAVRAFTALEETDAQARETIDDADLPDTIIPVRSVSLGVAPTGTAESELVFNTLTALSDGNFLGTAALPDGYSVWARACLGATCGPAVGWAQPVQFVSAVSTKVHGSAGTFDIELPLDGSGIECRSGGTNNDYTLVFTFAEPLSSVALASVSSGSGSVASAAVGADAHQYIVNLTGVTNAQRFGVTLSNVHDAAGNVSDTVSATVAVLVGDTTKTGAVNSSDISETKAQSGQSATTANFRQDVTANGSINSSDISLVKSKSGTGLP